MKRRIIRTPSQGAENDQIEIQSLNGDSKRALFVVREGGLAGARIVYLTPRTAFSLERALVAFRKQARR